jgi:raffinose/stachyose/melibiose transport system substrate-binding protein
MVCAGTVVFAGGGGQQGGSSAAAKTTLNFWSWRVEDVAAYEKLFKVFEQKNPGLSVIHTPYRNTDYNTILQSALAGGSGPDVFMARSYGGMEALAQSGYMTALDNLMPELRNFNDANRRGATSVNDGKIYGVPMASQTCVIFYNSDIYNRLNLKIPVTWADFIANMEAIKRAGIIPIGNGGKDGWVFETMVGNLAPNFYGATAFFDAARNGSKTFEDPAFITAIQRIKDLEPYMPPMLMGVSYDDGRALFINEQAAHFIGGSYDAAFFSVENPRLKYDIFQSPVARAGDAAYAAVYADGSYAMNTATPYKDQGLTLLKFFAGKDTGEMHVKDLKWVTAVPGVDSSSEPFISKILDFQKNNTPHIMVVGFRYGQPTGSVELQAAMQGMFGGQLTPAQVAKQIQDGIATWHKPFQR